MNTLNLTKLDPLDFDLLYQLMEEAFPPDERRTYEGQKQLLQRPEYTVLVNKEDGVLRGFLAYWDLGDILFAEHFAVNSAIRGGGLGGKMLSALLERVTKPIILEVELPQTDIARRRIGFYQRLGFCLNDYPYEQPPMQPDTDWLPLLVMSYPNPIDEKTFPMYKYALYTTVYGVKEDV